MTGPGTDSRAAGAPVPAPAPSSSSSDLSGSATPAATPLDRSSITNVSTGLTTYRRLSNKLPHLSTCLKGRSCSRDASETDCSSKLANACAYRHYGPDRLFRVNPSHARLPPWAVRVVFCAPCHSMAGFVCHGVAKLIIYPEREVRFSIDLNHETVAFLKG